MYISYFTTDIRYIKSSQNLIADCLSRPACINAVYAFNSVNLLQIADEQNNEEELQNFISNAPPGFNLSRSEISGSIRTIWCDIASECNRVLVPAYLTKQVFDSIHNLAHTGGPRSLQLIQQRYFWPNMQKQILAFAKTCVACQKAKVARHMTAPLKALSSPDVHFYALHCDIVGPLPITPDGYQYLFTIID